MFPSIGLFSVKFIEGEYLVILASPIAITGCQERLFHIDTVGRGADSTARDRGLLRKCLTGRIPPLDGIAVQQVEVVSAVEGDEDPIVEFDGAVGERAEGLYGFGINA